jgi:hypothetical protein
MPFKKWPIITLEISHPMCYAQGSELLDYFEVNIDQDHWQKIIKRGKIEI